MNETKNGRKITMRAKTDLVIQKVMILSFRGIGLLPPKLFSSEETRATHHFSARFHSVMTLSRDIIAMISKETAALTGTASSCNW
jgi:hypothetical protein